MSQHTHFDEEKIEKVNAQFLERCASRLELPGLEGAESRMKAEVMPHFYRVFAREVNRGTDWEHMCGSVVSVMTHMAMSFVASSVPRDAGLEARAELTNIVLGELSEFLTHALNNPDGMFASVKPEQSGRA